LHHFTTFGAPPMFDQLRPFHSLARWAGIVALLLILPATHAAGLNDTGITTCSNKILCTNASVKKMNQNISFLRIFL
jgi:hypothetical protein